jgi:hypothetical protein
MQLFIEELGRKGGKRDKDDWWRKRIKRGFRYVRKKKQSGKDLFNILNELLIYIFQRE